MHKEEGSATLEIAYLLLFVVFLWVAGFYVFQRFAMPYIESVQAEAAGATAQLEGNAAMSSFFTQLNSANTADNTTKANPKELADGHTYHVATLKPVSNSFGDSFVFTIVERPGFHFFANKALTRKFKQIWDAGKADELPRVACSFLMNHADMYDTDYVDIMFRD